MRRNQSLQKVVEIFARMHDKCVNEIRGTFDGVAFKPTDTPATLNMFDGDVLDIQALQLGGKPVIYLFSPAEIQARVRLTLVEEWKLSVIYPVVPIKLCSSSCTETIEWDVETRTDGSLYEKNTNLEVSYLFWEALYVRFHSFQSSQLRSHYSSGQIL